MSTQTTTYSNGTVTCTVSVGNVPPSYDYDVSDFNAMDTNKNQFVEYEELQKQFPQATKESVEESIKLWDINGDGKVSLGEHAYGTIGDDDIDLNKITNPDSKEALSQYDLNGDGKITQDEIKTHDKEIDKGSGLSTAAIIGIVVGAVCVVGLVVGLIVYLSRDKKKDKEANAEKGQFDEKKEEKQENAGNNFDKKEKDIDYNVKTNLHSINQSQEKQI
ncbi:MAG: hypothetical protein IJT14_04420 [Rickettsiales bacterium]|nr:hypothetical protein [Rickettsiales bacterium]